MESARRLFSQATLTVDNSLAHSSLASSIRHDSRVTGTAAAGSFPPSYHIPRATTER